MAARLRWRALWRCGMRVPYDGRGLVLDNFGIKVPRHMRVTLDNLCRAMLADADAVALALYRHSSALADNAGLRVYTLGDLIHDVKERPGPAAKLARRYFPLRLTWGYFDDMRWPKNGLIVPLLESPDDAKRWAWQTVSSEYLIPWDASDLVNAARAAGPTPTAEDIEEWARMAAESRQQTIDATFSLFDIEDDFLNDD